MPNNEHNCGNCHYRVEAKGECHRFPPAKLEPKRASAHGNPPLPAPEWPEVAESDWCGEWRPRGDLDAFAKQRDLSALPGFGQTAVGSGLGGLGDIGGLLDFS